MARRPSLQPPVLWCDELDVCSVIAISRDVKWAGYKWVARVQIDMVQNGQTQIKP